MLTAVSLALYPALVYLGIAYLQVRYVAGILLALFLLRIIFASATAGTKINRAVTVIAVTGGLLCIIALLFDDRVSLKLYPVAVNLVLAWIFYISLLRPPSVIERLARLQNPALSPEAAEHTRKTTIAWLIFFIANGAVSSYSSCCSSFEFWALYNGLISYLFMGVLFLAEFAVRVRLRRKLSEDARAM